MIIQNIRNSIVDNLPLNEENKKILNRRLNKVVKDPKGFIEGSYKKRSKQFIDKLPIRYNGKTQFTVLSAVYNVEKYLDDYFESLIFQSLIFKKYIQIIMVDDGSTDTSADIIKKWQKKYPNNIKYIYKENGGQSSARNLGMRYIETEWVTFIDPDDFINKNYFKIVSDKIEKDKSVNMIATNLKFYIEDERSIQDKHSLNYRFKNRVEKHSSSDLKDFINLSAAATFFKTEIITGNNIEFNENIRPNFEDGKLIADYLMVSTGQVAFLRDAVYFYRKRSDKSSTVDNSWEVEQKYNDVLKYGYLPMLEGYNKHLGYVPKHIQRTVLYDISWYLRLLINDSEKISFLTLAQKNIFYDLLISIFAYIDNNVVLDFNLSGLWFAQKIGILGAFKNEKYKPQITYIENVDREKKQILISYFTYFDIDFSFRIDGKDVIPKYEKVVNNSFVDRDFVKEKRFWIPFESEHSLLTVILDNTASRITLNKKQYINGVKIKDILEVYKPSTKYQTDGSWLLIDRDVQADDNAEHMYRYIMHNHPEQKCYFALSENSHDWKRLKLEKFNLIAFGTEDFEYHLRKSSKIISSHLDDYMTNYFADNYEYSKKFVFLQHGVTKDNLSKWFNTKKNLQLIITTTNDEYQSLVENNGNYKLTDKEVKLTGFPRHDSLLKNNFLDSKIILIMPTWRHNIMGKIISVGNTRQINKEFINTDYAQHWYSLLHSKKLLKLVQEYNYKIIFAPHTNIEPYISMFNVPSYIDIWQSSTSSTSMQQLFQQAKLMITDYSSVAFEMGLLNKTVLYYQFDQEEVFSGAHIYQKGYFSYENDGFGPIVIEEEVLLIELERILANDGKPLEPYLTRMQDTFAYRDTNNCQRVYEAIMDLDRPDTSEISVDMIMDYAQQAITHEAWDLALERIERALQHSDITQMQLEQITQIKESVLQTGYQDEPVKLASILWHEKRLEEALEMLRQVDDTKVTDELLRLRVKLAILDNDFILARDSQKILLEEYSDNCTIEDWQFYTQLANI